MPFTSKAQMRGAFSGALGPEMKAKAQEWAKETPNIQDLPEHVKPKNGKRTFKVKRRRDLVELK
jgi:hypothetical protein